MTFVLPTDDELKARLTPEEYEVMRNNAVEIPYTGSFLGPTPPGTFKCKVCGNHLFASTAKFDSMMGWPSFDEAIPGSVVESSDVNREARGSGVSCARCGSNLGLLLQPGPSKTGKVYNIYSVSIELDTTVVPAPRAPAARDTEETVADLQPPQA